MSPCATPNRTAEGWGGRARSGSSSIRGKRHHRLEIELGARRAATAGTASRRGKQSRRWLLLHHRHPDFGPHLGMDFRDPRRLSFGGSLLGDTLFRETLAFVGDLILVGLRRRIGEPLWQQVISGVA